MDRLLIGKDGNGMIDIADNKPIEILELSTRSHNALRRAGIDTVGELRRAYGNGGPLPSSGPRQKFHIGD